VAPEQAGDSTSLAIEFAVRDPVPDRFAVGEKAVSEAVALFGGPSAE
jgi:hypothetical protein